MGFNLQLYLELLSIILASFVGFFAYNIYLFNQSKKQWLFIAVASVLLIFKSLISYLILIGFSSQLVNTLNFYKSVLEFIIVLFLFIGMLSLLRQFESFKVLEEQVAKSAVLSKVKKSKP